MIRVTTALLVMTVASALGVVAARHETREQTTALDIAQRRAQALEIEWRQLQLEQSKLAASGRIKQEARGMGLREPQRGETLVIGQGFL